VYGGDVDDLEVGTKVVDWDEQPQVSGQSPALPAESKQNMRKCFRWIFFPIPFPG
jgi:hypothetical protein